MGRSQETFSKKEKEKKKLAKRREKEEKKEERKSVSKKGQGLDEMMAYVDEYGNITDTPPDPKKKLSINAEDIQLGAARHVEQEPVDTTRNGVVTFFNTSKGFGFIKDKDSGESVFVHINQVSEAIAENDKVTFETEQSPRGLSAVNVKVIR